MVYLTTKEAVLFPRPDSVRVRKHQDSVRVEGGATIRTVRERFASSDDRGAIGRFISETAERQVLILGRFKAARKAVLEALRSRLFELDRGYMPCVFDFEVPKGRRLGESALLLAGLSRFVIADLTDPSSVPAELEKMITQFPSVPVQPILLRGRKPYPLFEDHMGKPNVLEIVYYKDQSDLLSKLERDILAPAGTKAATLRKSPFRGAS
jgi:hypothetical protein